MKTDPCVYEVAAYCIRHEPFGERTFRKIVEAAERGFYTPLEAIKKLLDEV